MPEQDFHVGKQSISSAAVQQARVRNATLSIVNGLVLFLTMASAFAEESSPQQVAAGRVFAQKVCAACHVVTGEAGEAPMLRQPAPSFLAIAKRSDFSPMWLRDFLKSNHSWLGPREAMPNPALLDYQIDELAAYFGSLKP